MADNSLMVATIVPTYNRAASVVDALDSVSQGTRSPDRLIVIDDGSTDETLELVTDWIARNHDLCSITFLQQPNRGVGAARARAIAEATNFDLLSFLDSDDLWPADYLQRAYEVMEHEPELIAVHRDQVLVDSSETDRRHLNMSVFEGDVKRPLFEVFCNQLIEVPSVRQTFPPIPSSTVVRTRAALQAGSYDPDLRIRNDADFHLRLSLEGPWRHLEGEPIVKRVSNCGAVQLTRDIDSVEQKMVMGRILANFLLAEKRRGASDLIVWGKPLFDFWIAQGRALWDAGHADLSDRCTRVGMMLVPIVTA